VVIPLERGGSSAVGRGLNCATYWNKSWPHIQDHLEQKLHKETDALYSKLNKKIDNLMDRHTRKTKHVKLYIRVNVK
jgi:hypothetical protein